MMPTFNECPCGRKKRAEAVKCRRCYERIKNGIERDVWQLDYSVLAELRLKKESQLVGSLIPHEYREPEDLDHIPPWE